MFSINSFSQIINFTRKHLDLGAIILGHLFEENCD